MYKYIYIYGIVYGGEITFSPVVRAASLSPRRWRSHPSNFPAAVEIFECRSPAVFARATFRAVFDNRLRAHRMHGAIAPSPPC